MIQDRNLDNLDSRCILSFVYLYPTYNSKLFIIAGRIQ